MGVAVADREGGSHVQDGVQLNQGAVSRTGSSYTATLLRTLSSKSIANLIWEGKNEGGEERYGLHICSGLCS